MSLGNNVDSTLSNNAVNSERSRRKTMTLQLPLAALSAANVVDAKYDSDSDFDYRRQKPSRLEFFSSFLFANEIQFCFTLDLITNDEERGSDVPVVIQAVHLTMPKLCLLCQESGPLKRSSFRPLPLSFDQHQEARKGYRIGELNCASNGFCINNNKLITCKN